MTECAVTLCDGTMEGQMLACPPHWSLLEVATRVNLVRAWDDMARAVVAKDGPAADAAGTRWHELVRQAHDEWKAVRERLGTDSARGIEWVRALRGQERTVAP